MAAWRSHSHPDPRECSGKPMTVFALCMSGRRRKAVAELPSGWAGTGHSSCCLRVTPESELPYPELVDGPCSSHSDNEGRRKPCLLRGREPHPSIAAGEVYSSLQAQNEKAFAKESTGSNYGLSGTGSQLAKTGAFTELPDRAKAQGALDIFKLAVAIRKLRISPSCDVIRARRRCKARPRTRSEESLWVSKTVAP